jgi:hypothetical protein
LPGGFQFLGALVHPAGLHAEEDVPRVAHRVGLGELAFGVGQFALGIGHQVQLALVELLQVGEFAPTAVQHGAQVQHQLLQVLLGALHIAVQALELGVDDARDDVLRALVVGGSALDLALDVVQLRDHVARLLLLNTGLQLVHLLLVPSSSNRSKLSAMLCCGYWLWSASAKDMRWLSIGRMVARA